MKHNRTNISKFVPLQNCDIRSTVLIIQQRHQHKKNLSLGLNNNTSANKKVKKQNLDNFRQTEQEVSDEQCERHHNYKFQLNFPLFVAKVVK